MEAAMEDVSGVDIPDDQVDGTTLPLSEKEKTILELYDRLLESEVELALFRARQAFTIDEDEQVSQEDIERAQERLLEARASWTLRNDVVGSVMMVNPIIKAVHRGTDASPIERDLLPRIEERDTASSAIAKQHGERQKVVDELRTIQVEAIQTGRRNVELAAEVLELAEAANRNQAESNEDPGTKDEIDRLTREVKASRQRWKVMKGTASAVVAGSGVDWVKDPELRNIVLDPD